MVVKRGPYIVVLAFLFLLSGIHATSNTPYFEFASDNSILETNDVSPLDDNYISDTHEIQGLLDPIIVEQRGFSSSGPQATRTDTNPSVTYDLPLDDDHGWVGSQAEVEITDLNRLYVVNGTFENGIPGQDILDPATSINHYPYGWNATAYNPDTAQTQVSAYDDAGSKFIVVENQGKKIGPSGNQYDHVAGSEILWYQIIDNVPYTEEFYLNFKYYYSRGPLGSGVAGEGRIFVMVDGTILWNTSIPDLPARQTWYSILNLPVTISGAGSSFNFSVGIIVDETFDLNSAEDNDGDGYADGIANTVYLTTWFDDISLVGQASPEFEAVDMQFTAGAESTPIIGSLGTGNAVIRNSTNWQLNPVHTIIASNTSVSFNYEVRLLSHKYKGSNFATSPSELGVNYQVSSNTNSELSFYTYLGSLGAYENLNISVAHPDDWENATIYDPQSSDVTSQCEFAQGVVTIPTALLIDRLGWWFISIESPNYLDSLIPEIYELDGDQWTSESIYRSGNRSRIAVSIGSGANIPDPLNLVNITWIMPDGSTWFDESVSGGSLGVIHSDELVFGSLNTTAGQWQALVAWTNGTELAFGSISFEVNHGTILSPYTSSIEAPLGTNITNFIYFQDAENGAFITDPAATITANWSSTTVNFVPNPILNRWYGTFNTSLVGSGIHLVVVNASGPYFDDASCTFNVSIPFVNNDLTIDNPTPGELGIGDIHLATFTYSDTYGIGIPDADVSIQYTGTAGGVTWTEPVDLGDGDYSVAFTAVHSGSYVITITASKAQYEVSSDALSMSVGDKTTLMDLENGTSAVIGFGESYRLVVSYVNGTGHGLEGANVSIVTTNPEVGIGYTSSTDEGNGFYSFILTPGDMGTWTILIQASIQDHSIQGDSFTLTATPVSAQLNIAGGSNVVTTGVEQTVDILVFYIQTSGTHSNISSASIDITFTSVETLEAEIIPQTEGYVIRFTPSQKGLFEFTITASKPGFQNDFVEFTLIVQERAIRVELVDGALEWIRRSPLYITIRLIEVDTNQTVPDAVVSFKLYRLSGVEMDGYLNEGLDGVYSVIISPQWIDDAGYTVQILLNKTNYALDVDYVFTVFQTTPPDILWIIMVETYGPPIVGMAVVAIVSVSGRVLYRRRKRKEFATFIENQRRFDDADNIIGVIVMHKKSGIPIYSRIVKGGFEEGIVAAFISAVTTFRDEFEMLDEESMRVIPISDIIRAVQTPNLICAFITVRSASMEHNRKIEVFSRETSRYLDDFYMDSKPPSTMDPRIAEIINFIFDETMDGVLLKYHKIGSKRIPKRYKPVEQVLTDEESHYCARPVNLARALSKYGVPEARGCTLVSEAIEKEYIVLCEEEEFPESDFDLHTFLNNNKKDE